MYLFLFHQTLQLGVKPLTLTAFYYAIGTGLTFVVVAPFAANDREIFVRGFVLETWLIMLYAIFFATCFTYGSISVVSKVL